ncbi:MAG: peptidyl-prolyl cis-trans isomerase [Planctomycetales bacterium]|nr:peptidyl-prolyl cis-trans isomerase [Planctomycetales bacterium]
MTQPANGYFLVCALLAFQAEAMTVAWGQENESVQQGNKDSGVLAWVGTRPIRQADIHFMLGRRPAIPKELALTIGITDSESSQRADVNSSNRSARGLGEFAPLEQSVTESAIALLAKQWQALNTMKVRHLVLDSKTIDAWILAQRFASEEIGADVVSHTEHLANQWAITPDVYRDLVTFRLSWQAYLGKHLTNENMEKHFKKQPQRFDGTQFKISMISARVPLGQSAQRDATRAALSELRVQSSDTDEVWKQAKTLQNERWMLTDATWVRGYGDVEDAVVTLLMTVEEDSWSEPVDTLTGVHLLRLEEVRAGSSTLQEVQGQVRSHMLVYLLDYLAAQSSEQLPLRMNLPIN